MKKNTIVTYPDYKKIRKDSHCTDCTISEADFNTNRPNPYRISAVASDINRYLRYGTGGRV